MIPYSLDEHFDVHQGRRISTSMQMPHHEFWCHSHHQYYLVVISGNQSLVCVCECVFFLREVPIFDGKICANGRKNTIQSLLYCLSMSQQRSKLESKQLVGRQWVLDVYFWGEDRSGTNRPKSMSPKQVQTCWLGVSKKHGNSSSRMEWIKQHSHIERRFPSMEVPPNHPKWDHFKRYFSIESDGFGDVFGGSPILQVPPPFPRSTVAQRPGRGPQTWPISWERTIPPSTLGQLPQSFENGRNPPVMAVKKNGNDEMNGYVL